MTFPTVFANLAAGDQPASLLDTMFDIAGAAGAIPCTATGTNAITLTPITNFYQPPAYADYQIVSFTAANSASGPVTIQLGALAFINLYMPSGLQANSGDIISGHFYIAAYIGTLNTGSGGFQIFNASTPSVVQPIQSGFKNLKITNGGTPTTQVAVTADQVMLQTAAGGAAAVRSVNVTISTGTSGANGLDSGSVASSTFYAVYVIFNGSTIAGLISLSATSPTLPAGYTYFARVGWVVTDGSTNLQGTLQYGRRVQYLVGVAATTDLPYIANGVLSAWTAYSVTGVVPSTASRISIAASAEVITAGTSNLVLIVAPNNSYGVGSITAPYPPYAVNTVSNAIGTFVWNTVFEFTLESTNIYAGATQTGDMIANLFCLGWEDNL